MFHTNRQGATLPSGSLNTTAPATRKRYSSYSYLYGGMHPTASNNNNLVTAKIVMIALAAAVPAFFMGTTLSFYLGLDNPGGHCHCDPRSLQLAESLRCPPPIPPRCNSSATTAIPAWTEPSARPAVLPAWVEEVVRERLHEQRLALGQPAAAAATHCPDTSGGGLTLDARKVGNYLSGMALTPKANFTQFLDLGVPIDPVQRGSTDILMIYSNPKTMPEALRQPGQSQNADGLVELTTQEALAGCEFVNVLLTDHQDSRFRSQCLAVVPQYESYHLQRWGRLNVKTQSVEMGHPLQLISAGMKRKGAQEYTLPTEVDMRKAWHVLKTYLQNVDVVLAELKVILEDIAIGNRVIVMVCNFGQSELLINFCCSAHARGFDISNVIVFPTDQATDDLARGLGLATYFDHRNFADIPTEAADRYGDDKFVAMMMAKVLSVHLVSMLGYDFLFSDVDIVWFKNPLEFFAGPDSPVLGHDIIFQDDGSRTMRYAPYSANSGFYYVRHNPRTRYFLTSLLMRTDAIFSTRSHQKAMVVLMTEHATLYGLKAKVISRTQEELPGGFQYNQKSGQYMRDLFAGNIDPYIFHMSWTKSKEDKVRYLQQLEEWFVSDVCMQTEADRIAGFEEDSIKACCSAAPLATCHYRDKPSKHPCRDSPSLDTDRHGKPFPSFWP